MLKLKKKLFRRQKVKGHLQQGPQLHLRIITHAETHVDRYKPGQKQQSSQWQLPSSVYPKNERKRIPVCNVYTDGFLECAQNFFFFFCRRYNPLWVSAFSVIFFHSVLPLLNFSTLLFPSSGYLPQRLQSIFSLVFLLFSYPLASILIF